MSGLVTATELN